MPVIDQAEFAQSDIFLDHRLEEIMFRWDHNALRGVQRFYGSPNESPLGEDSGLYREALRWGERLSEDQYFSPARRFAAEAHEGQRFGTHQSYLFHLDSLASNVRTQGLPTHVESAAYLHGVLTEGRDVTETDVRARFPEEVVRLVLSLTRTERITLQQSLEQIRAAGSDAVCLKLLDSFSHCQGAPNEVPQQDVRARYRAELPMFRNILHRVGEHDLHWTRLEHVLAVKSV
jgi:(p)ppGpp synthase/HD superfamily hydrolase